MRERNYTSWKTKPEHLHPSYLSFIFFLCFKSKNPLGEHMLALFLSCTAANLTENLKLFFSTIHICL
jgi:hypothetical protein